ncbi:hypothetical protein L1987_43293 [Smallanthus sonchifolius]|uniref:Uncharacterized protein n=1 Tax=Smallanthus sonchifolius TaxID=185202 RepID=A0ACB9GL27_9ASTR|nr:hypothetical protein L1987_43293 [Smallanthus sonchifolius]
MAYMPAHYVSQSMKPIYTGLIVPMGVSWPEKSYVGPPIGSVSGSTTSSPKATQMVDDGKKLEEEKEATVKKEPLGNIVETGDSSVDVSKTVNADKVCDVNAITVGLGFSNKGLVNSVVSQADECKPTSHVSKNCLDQIIHVAKEFIPIKFVKEGTMEKQNSVPKVSKNDDYVASSDNASHFVLYPTNL